MGNPLFQSPAFRQSRPVLLTSFINTVGSIGLSLVPILLVKRGVSTAQGAIVLGTLKATIIVGTIAGGALADRIEARTVALAGLLMSAVGLGMLPFQSALALILLFGIVAQLADAQLKVVQRLLLMDQVDSQFQKESLGWLRLVSNFAQIFSYAIAAAFAAWGVAPLMVLDAATSCVAFLIGRRILPHKSRARAADGGLSGDAAAPASKAAFFGLAVVLMGWSFFYELFLEGGAGRLEVLHPGEGLRRFSSMMILNTALCAAFALHATRIFRRSWSAMAGGFLLQTAGIMVAVRGMADQRWVFGGMLLITFGELMFSAVSQYTLMRMTPSNDNAGLYYSVGLTIMRCGQIAGAALAFPLLIHAPHLARFTGIIAGVLAIVLLLLTTVRPEIERLS